MTDTPIDVLNKYSKQMEDLVENAEIEAELEAEKHIRTKNTKMMGISSIAIAFMAITYFIVQNNSQPLDPGLLESNEHIEKIEAAQKDSAIIAQKAETIEPTQATAPALAETVEEKTPSPQGRVTKTSAAPVKFQAAPTPKSQKERAAKVAAQAKPIEKKKSSVSGKTYSLQLGAFSVKRNADNFSSKLEKKGFDAMVVAKNIKKTQYAVVAGVFPNKESAEVRNKELSEKGYKPSLKEMESGHYAVIAGNRTSKKSADKLQNELSLKGFLSSASPVEREVRTYTVQIKDYPSIKNAKQDQVKLASLGIRNSFIH